MEKTIRAEHELHRRRLSRNVGLGVVLIVFVGLVAEPYRTHSAIAGQCIGCFLRKFGLQSNAIDRLHPAAFRHRYDIHDPADIVFHCSYGGETIERANDEESIAHPAEAIIPVAARVGSLRNAGGHCRDDGACRFVSAKF